MKNFCLLKDQIDILKPKMKALGGQKLVTMSSSERADFFSETLGKTTGKQVAATFEQAMISKQKGALKNWAETVFTPKEKATKTYNDVISKINNLSKEGVLSPSLTDEYLENLIATELGVDLKPEEIKKINDMSLVIQEKEKLTPNTQFFGYNKEYFLARKEMMDYLESITPSPTLDTLFGTIGKGNLLASIKTMTTNVVSNISNFITEPLVRRIVARRFSGVNSDLIIPFIQEAYKIHRDTGYDVVRMFKMKDHQKTLGENRNSNQGPGAVKAVARVYEDIIFKKFLGTPDILAGAAHFADGLNLTSSAIADKEGLSGEEHKARARELFLKATQLSETNDEIADILRAGAIDEALYGTFQQDSWYAKVALSIRNSLDEVTGGLKLGTNLDPFIKTPINVLGAGMEYAGYTLPFATIKLAHDAYSGNEKDVRGFSRQLVRSGLGITIAMLLSGLLDDDQYVPDFTVASPKQKEITRLSNASYNSIRIGNKWVSLDYWGPVGVALAGIMGARQKQGALAKGASYIENSFTQMRRSPIIATLFNIYNWYDENKKYGKDAEEQFKEMIGNLAGAIWVRAVPMIVSDVAKALDDKQRYNDYNNWVDDIQAQIPFARELLPPKYNDFGAIVPTENAFWTIVAGARVKTANDDKVYREILDLSNQGQDVVLTTRNFKDMKTARLLLSPREFNELEGVTHAAIRDAYLNVSETDAYKEAEPEQKKKLLEQTRTGVMQMVLSDSGYMSRIKQYEYENKK